MSLIKQSGNTRLKRNEQLSTVQVMHTKILLEQISSWIHGNAPVEEGKKRRRGRKRKALQPWAPEQHRTYPEHPCYLQSPAAGPRRYWGQSHFPRHLCSRFHWQFLKYPCHQSNPSCHGFQTYGACHPGYPELWLWKNKRFLIFWKASPITSDRKSVRVH